MKKFKLILFSILVLSTIFGEVNISTAYFTSYVETYSRSIVKRVIKASFEEVVDGYTKTLFVENSDDSCRMYARCKVLYPRSYSIEVNTNEYWKEENDDGWYYSDLIEPDTITPSMEVNILNVDGTNIQPTSADIDLNVIVIYEFIPVNHLPDGTPYPNWGMTANIVEEAR